MRDPLTVLKFGGSVLRSEEHIDQGVHEIYRWLRRGRRVVAVVSAIEGTTDALLHRARLWTAEAGDDALALLLSTGEFTTAALLTLALTRAGVPARVLGPHALGLRTHGSGVDANPASIDREALLRALEAAPVAVVPGFIGVGDDRALTLLGRGGSDLTALFIAAELGGAHCRLIKDVDGLCDRDPALPGPAPRRYRTLSWTEALRLDGAIIQHKAVRLAEARGLSFEVGAFHRDDVSTVGAHRHTWHGAVALAPRPLRVAVLGCGVVGCGVVAHLHRLRRHFEICGVLVRDPSRAREGADGLPLTLDAETAAADADIVVELLGGLEPAGEIVSRALREGRHVITANKSLIAARGAELMVLAERGGVLLRYSAAVGGGVPMIECVDDLARGPGVQAIEGVVNGTSNFVLERLAAGDRLDEAVSEARRLGYAEADPTRDLDGTDALEKLIVLARCAFDGDASAAAFARIGLLGPELDALARQRRPGEAVRLIAWARRTASGIVGGVSPRIVPRDHVLHAVPQAQNRLVVRDNTGRVHIRSGAGAGRWPTSESVLADILDVWRAARADLAARVEEANLVA